MNNGNMNQQNNQNNGQQYQQPQQPQYQQPQYQQPQYQQPQYQQPQYQQPQYQQPQKPARNPNDGRAFSIAALVTGCCACALSFFNFVFMIILLACGIVAIILGVKGRQMSAACYGKPSGLSTAGLVLGIVGTAVCGLNLLAYIACAAALDSVLDLF